MGRPAIKITGGGGVGGLFYCKLNHLSYYKIFRRSHIQYLLKVIFFENRYYDKNTRKHLIKLIQEFMLNCCLEVKTLVNTCTA